MASLCKRMVHLCDYHLFRVSGGVYVHLYIFIYTEICTPVCVYEWSTFTNRVASSGINPENDLALAPARDEKSAMDRG